MKLTPQRQTDMVDLDYLSERLRAAGVCLTDDRLQPIGTVDPLFAGTLLPAARNGDTAGIVTEAIDLQVTRQLSRPLRLIACATPPATSGSEGRDIPLHTPRSLRRLIDDIAPATAGMAELQKSRAQVEDLSDQLANTYEELSLVYELGEHLSVNSPPLEFLETACLQTAAVMELRGIGVLVWDEGLRERHRCMFGVEMPEARLAALDDLLRGLIDPDDDASGVQVNQVDLHPALSPFKDLFTQILAVPMRRHGRLFGCAFALDKNVPPEIFGTFNRGVFTSIDRKLLLGVALHVALYLENRKLFLDAEDLLMGFLHSMVAAVDAKDTYTCGHSVRVGLFAKRLAQEAGFDDAYCERVYLSGLLHDVGKIGVDDAVLRKPGRLTDEEFGIIKRHPEIGFKILRGISQISDVLPGVLYHHERYGGGGYPHRLAGEEIPLLGRIMCIADSFDAMTSSRTYRPALTLGKAMDEIEKCRSTQFDPVLADAFARIPESEIVTLIATERERPESSLPTLQRVA